MATFEDSKRVKAFRRDLISKIPRFPNDKASLLAMEAKTLTDLLITHIGWRIRLVASRSRRVEGEGILASDPRAMNLQSNLAGLFAAVRRGDHLTPYMSLEASTRGYTPAADPKSRGPNLDTWADKDFFLNVMGLHHFHLGLTKEKAGHMVRTNEVLFASVTRDEFEVIGLFDHDAFERLDDGSMTKERERLWTFHTDRQQTGLLPGQLSLGGFGGLGVSLSSQPVAVVRTAQHHVAIMREVDPKLDDRAYVCTLYPQGQVPAKPKLNWHYRHLDFGLLDAPAGFFGSLHRGPN